MHGRILFAGYIIAFADDQAIADGARYARNGILSRVGVLRSNFQVLYWPHRVCLGHAGAACGLFLNRQRPI